mgnify:FL=1
MNKEHNGWTNYATWRINLEVIDGLEIETAMSACEIKEIVEDIVFSQYELGNGSHLVEDYARSFVAQVNFYEIAESINEGLDEQD